VPRAPDLEELNRSLLDACREDEGRVLAGRDRPVGAALLAERGPLLPLAGEGLDLAEVGFATVDGLGRVRVRTNAYSAPLPPGTAVQVKVLPAAVELWHGGACVARHPRSYGRHQDVLDLEHYLDVLVRKPGALAGSAALARWRRAGRWPASYDRFWQALAERRGREAGARAMVELLQLGRAHGYDRLGAALEAALALGCHDPAAVRHLLAAPALARGPAAALAVGPLAAYDRPPPALGAYDALLAAPAGAAGAAEAAS
jgi:hypothetical protein